MFFTFFFFKTKPTKVCEFSKCLSGFHAFCVSVKAKIFLKYPYVSKKKKKTKNKKYPSQGKADRRFFLR